VFRGVDLAKKKAAKPKRELTKRQLSRWQQQRRRQRIIFGSGILIIVAVLGVFGAGVYNRWYIPEYKPLRETVIEVNGIKFDMDYYIKMLKYYAGTSTQYIQFMADYVITIIEQNELIRQESMELGISVSEEEVDKALKSYNPPLSKDYRDVARTQLLVSRLRDEYFDKQVPVSAEQRHIFAMFLESESQVNEVKARLEGGEDFSKLAGELSLDSTSKTKEGDLGWHPRGVLPLLLGTSVLDEPAFSIEAGTLSQPIYDETKTKMVGYWLIEVEFVDEDAKIAQTKVMLLGSEQEASEVRARLEAGEDFATLAKELSQHADSKDKGGEFEVSQGTMSSAFDEFAFSADVGVLSQPIRDDTVSTEGGYWLLKVAEIDSNRQIDEDDRTLLKADALNKWVQALMDDPKNEVKSYLDDEKKQWAIIHAVGS
jgi:parvulin-like peptidyl-prolyl isomerase